MYFYVDHTSWFKRNTGVQRCVRSIASALIGQGVPLRPVVWDWQNGGFLQASPKALDHLSKWNGPSAESWAPCTFDATSVSDPTDGWLMIVELVNGATPLRNAADDHGWRVCWLFHDAIPVRWSYLYGERAAAMRTKHFEYMDGLSRFELVVSNSCTTGSHLIAHLNQRRLPSHHIRPLPLAEEFCGVARNPAPASIPARQDVWKLLCVGSLELRKNHQALFKALLWLQAHKRVSGLQLVLVGWAKDPIVLDQMERARKAGLVIHWEADADDAALVDFYAQSDFTVYPSLEEGFGLPVVEALWHRRICLCSGDGALGEISTHGGCALVDTHQWRSIAAGLERLFCDEAWRNQLQCQVESRTFRRWHDYAEDLLNLLVE